MTGFEIEADRSMKPDWASAKRGERATRIFAALGIAMFALAGAIVYRTVNNPSPMSSDVSEAAKLIAVPGDLELMSVDNAQQIVVEGQDAVSRNALVPVVRGARQTAASFRIAGADDAAQRAAFKCLTQAIYYEAGFEPIQGRRAVAQVVLNRVHHPAYPNSVCGVVYQGSQRRTGCQFSFTCDGSLLRSPAPQAWRAAQDIARAALAGEVEPRVGTSTHYHADYVLPKWAFTLGKLHQIGRHIFYRFRGRGGNVSAFTARYAGFEVIPSTDLAQLRARVGAAGVLAESGNTPGLSVTPHITDRHAGNDVGGRLDTRTTWRLSIPDPVKASARYSQIVGQSGQAAALVAVNDSGERVAAAEPLKNTGIAIP